MKAAVNHFENANVEICLSELIDESDEKMASNEFLLSVFIGCRVEHIKTQKVADKSGMQLQNAQFPPSLEESLSFCQTF